MMCLKVSEVTACSLCSLPVCRARQAGCAAKHRAECELLTEKDDLKTVSKDDLYTIVAILRLLWQIERDNNIRKVIMIGHNVH